jgi:CRISPR-associated protein Cmr2
MNYVLAVSIGPVQDFIASARRSRDLWFGSWLLSELSKAAAREIADREGKVSCLIFPSPSEKDGLLALEPGSEFNVANKIVAVVKDEIWRGSNGTLELKGVLDAVAKRLDDIRRDAFSQHNIPGPYFHSATAVMQVSDLIESTWAAAPLPDSPEGYRRARDAAERLLAAQKTTRTFRPTREWARPVPKSSFDGARESVIDEKVYNLVRRGS